MSERKLVLLISGTAGAYTIRGQDLQDTIYDKGKAEGLIEQFYINSGSRIVPESAYYIENGKKRMLLRHNRSGYPPLVTRTLEDIFDKHAIQYISIPCDTMWEKLPFEHCKVDVVCLSTTFMWSEAMIKTAIEWVRMNVDFKHLVLGGHYSSIKYAYILESFPVVDYVIIGDGETALPRLVKYLLGEETVELSSIPNLAYMTANGIVNTPMKYEPLDTMEKVSYEGQFERLSYESVRGCAFGCKFCTWDAGIKCFRYKSAERIIKDCEEYMGENGIKRIEINDSTFLFPFSRIPELLEGFKRLGLHWKAHSRSDVPFDKEMVKALDESHCDILQIGFESMTDRILKNMAKKTTVAQNRHVNEIMKGCSVDTVISFIVGFPDETKYEFNNTYRFIVDELWGHFYIFVFEMEDKSLDLWKERDRYGFELFEDEEDCLHGGSNWQHNGMTSKEAFSLRADLLKAVRNKGSMAIYKSWQSPYEWPFIPERNKEENLKIERLLDNLVFLPCDYPSQQVSQEVERIRKQLQNYGVYFEGLDPEVDI